MELFDKFKIAFTAKYLSVNDEQTLKDLFEDLDINYINKLVDNFDFKKHTIKEIIIDNIVSSEFLSKIAYMYETCDSYLVNVLYNELERLSDNIYINIKNANLGE